MENESIIQQSKSDQKGKAIASLILGSISVLLVIILWIPSELSLKLIMIAGTLTKAENSQTLFDMWSRIFLLFALIGITGIITGIKGLKSTKKNLAKIGIIISVIGLILLGVTLLLYILLGVGWTS